MVNVAKAKYNVLMVLMKLKLRIFHSFFGLRRSRLLNSGGSYAPQPKALGDMADSVGFATETRVRLVPRRSGSSERIKFNVVPNSEANIGSSATSRSEWDGGWGELLRPPELTSQCSSHRAVPRQ